MQASADTVLERSRDLIQGIRNLESIGIDATLSSLPKFVVVGDQSHGKSSIIEAICGISLPRSAGTCTRCPFRITTTAARPGERWKCEIALSRRWASTSTGAHWRDTGDTRAFPFATVTDRTQLEHVLRRAQIAILNPHLDPAAVLQLSGFDTDTTTHLQSLSFSVNPIELYISGEELPELSITDLPGSINVAPDESEQHLVGLVEKLIKEHVNDEKALILLVASMDQDLETSTAFRFVGNCKALARSVGVLTKPDLLNRSRVEHVSRILSGKVFKLGNGWFVTKNLSQEELDRSMTHTEARDLEKRFFEGDPWSSSLANHQASFGTRQLQDTISSLLVSHIERELPGESRRRA